jgi:hypothetical protein
MVTDSKMPTESQRQELCKMLFSALLELRMFGYEGNSQRVADLADAFHNLPIYLLSEDFSFSFFRKFLESYQEKYTDAGGYNYVAMLDKITAESE